MFFRSLAAVLVLMTLVCRSAVPQDTAVSERARTLFRAGRYHELIRTIESARYLYLVAAQDLLILSVAYANTGQPERSRRTLAEAEALDPTDPSVQLAMGSLALQSENLAEAVTRFRRAHRLDPTSQATIEVLTATLVNYGAQRVLDGNRVEGYELLREAVAISPSSMVALRNLAVLSFQDGEVEEAARLADQALLLAPSDEDLHRLRVEALRKMESPRSQERLAAALRGLVAVKPEDLTALALLGRTLDDLGDEADALDTYARAAELGSRDPLVYDRLAAHAMDKDNYEKALTMTHLAITQSIQAASRLRLGAANSLEDGELTSLTEQDWERLTEIVNLMEEPLAILDRSINRLKTIHRTTEELEADLKRLTEWYPSSLELHQSLAAFYTDQRRWSDALTTWRLILSRNPNHGTAHLGMGRVLWETGRQDEARLAFRRALETEPEEPGVYIALKSAYAVRLSELREILLERTLRDDKNPTLFEELAAVEEKLGIMEDAATHRERAEMLRTWGQEQTQF